MSESIYLMTIFLFLGTILLIFGMRYLSATQQARARLQSGDDYRRLAERAAAVEAENGAALSAIQNALAEISLRLTAVERILKDVG